MTLADLGIVFNGGAGLAALRAALAADAPPTPTPTVREGVPVLAVPASALAGNPALAPARRADRFCKMSLAAALEAWHGCDADPRRVGIILSTALGPHATVFRYVNDLLDYGEAKTSPTVFSQSVHAAAASMITTAVGARGPVLNLSDLAFPFEEALTLAACWLRGGRCDTVLVGAADELSEVLAHVVRRKWPQPLPVLGEGAVFFRLARDGGVPVSVGTEPRSGAVLRLADACALGREDRGGADVRTRTFTHFWGATRIGGAFHLAAAWLLRREGLLPGGAVLPPGGIDVVAACGTRQRVIHFGDGARPHGT